MDFWAIAGPMTALLTFLGAIFNFSVIRPLNHSILNLKDMIIDVRVELRESEKKRQQMAEDLARVNSSLEDANRRISYVEEHYMKNPEA